MRIVVLSGGLSAERDVSVSTGVMVCNALRKKGHKAVLLDVFFGYRNNTELSHIFDDEYDFDTEASIVKESAPDITKIKAMRSDNSNGFFGENVIEICRMADIVFMALHGGDGENGKIQATFDLLGIKYTGTDSFGSSIAMSKALSKKIFCFHDIQSPECLLFDYGDKLSGKLEAGVSFPCVVKPCSGGSSIGVSIAQNREEYMQAMDMAFKYETNVMVEQYIKGREFSVGVLGGKSLPVIEIKPTSGFYDYVKKYQKGKIDEICPAELDEKRTVRLQEAAVKVFNVLHLKTYARIDFILGENDEIYCLEANTLPGMTPTSLLPQEAAAIGVSYEELCEQIIEESLLRYREKDHTEFYYHANDAGVKYSLDDMKGERNVYMKPMTLEQVANACGGTYFGDNRSRLLSVKDVAINTNKVDDGILFVALKGSVRDGHDFITEAYERGALCCLTEKKLEDETRPYILVASCLQALKDIAEYYRSLFNVKIVGITGSVGKTTTKEMVYSVLSQKYRVLKTLGNFNNEMGVPLTLFRLRDHHEIAIVEMGINHFGEMRSLSKMVRPDACLITNIGDSHLEFLGDREGVLRAKSEIFEYMKDKSAVFLNGDDDMLRTLENNGTLSPAFYGLKGGNSIYAEHITNMGVKGIRCGICAGAEKIDVTIPAFGNHMVMNALAASAVGLYFNMESDGIRRGIESFMPVNSRVSILENGHITIIDDCYNSNPTSARAAIDALSELDGRKVCILGDMKELGDNAPLLHSEVGRHAAARGMDVIICVGDTAKYMSQGAAETAKTSSIHYFTEMSLLERQLPSLISEGDTVLVKASRSMKFEVIVEQLKALA